MPSIPTGTVTFLFTDIEGSTKLAREHPETWEMLRARHHFILKSAIEAHNGYIFQIIGDAFCATFHTTEDAVQAAVESQKNLHAENWGDVPIHVRMGINTGKAEIQKNGEYHGYLAMSRVQRLMSAAHGGQTLLSSATEQLAHDTLPTDITLRDLGQRKLKDMPRPEHIFQLIMPNLPADFPPLRTLEASPNNLPTQLTSFIGREKELADVKRLLTNTHLLTLIGPGGTGKTRLSLQAATDLLETFPHSAWLVELAPISDPSLVASTTAAALNLPAEVHRPAIDMLCDYLRERELLIVLDNCEHLVGACARMADRLLHAAPKLRMIASSREALGIAGEVSYRVPSLGLPDLQNPSSFESLSQYESIKLFIDRATSAVSTFSVTNENVSAIAQICHRLDGIPLAIELAAAKIRALSVEQIAKRLDDRFRLLTGGSRTALERHQTLRAALDWSHNLLSPEEQILFRRLSIFVNGWTLEAAESVCADESTSGGIRSDDILNLLEHLVNKSLVSAEEWQSETRYRVLETMRQYAGEKLIEVGESENLRERHLEYYLDLAESAAPHLIKPEQLEWLARLEAEHENMRAALEWSLGLERPRYALRLVAALGTFWVMHCYWLEGAKWLERALAKPAQDLTIAEKTARTRALYHDSNLADQLDNLERLKTSAEASLALCEAGTDRRDLAIARSYLGLAFFRLGDYENGGFLFEQSLDEFRELKDLYWEAFTQRFLSDVLVKSRSESFAQELELARKAGERLNLAHALDNQAFWAWRNHQFDEAEAHLKEAEMLYDQIGYMASRVSHLQGLIAHYHTDFQQARLMYLKSKEQFELLGEKLQKSFALQFLAILARDEGNLQQAQTYVEEALKIAKEVGYRDIIGWRLALLGNIEFLHGNLESAKRNFKESLSIAKEVEERHPRCYTLFLFSNSYANLQPQIAMRVQGALHAYFKNKLNELIGPLTKRESDSAIAQARQRLDESAFNAAWAEGKKMTIDEALDLALKTVEEIK